MDSNPPPPLFSWDVALPAFRSLRPKRDTAFYTEFNKGKVNEIMQKRLSLPLALSYPTPCPSPVSRNQPCRPPCSQCPALPPDLRCPVHESCLVSRGALHSDLSCRPLRPASRPASRVCHAPRIVLQCVVSCSVICIALIFLPYPCPRSAASAISANRCCITVSPVQIQSKGKIKKMATSYCSF